MSAREFRFGATVGLVPTGADLLATAARLEERGYSTMLVADGLWLPSPFATLSAAAATTSSLRLGTYVLAAPLRAPASVARETDTVDLLSGHRFELGLGTGHPGIAADADAVGMPFGSPTERLARVAESIAAVRQRLAVQDRQAPRILLAGTGRKMVELAVENADTLAVPVPFDRPADRFAERVDQLRASAGSRFDRLELAMNVLAVGDKEPPEWVPGPFRDLPADSYSRLAGEPGKVADLLRRNRDRTGVSYVTVPQWHVDDFAPVVELLAGT